MRLVKRQSFLDLAFSVRLKSQTRGKSLSKSLLRTAARREVTRFLREKAANCFLNLANKKKNCSLLGVFFFLLQNCWDTNCFCFFSCNLQKNLAEKGEKKKTKVLRHVVWSSQWGRQFIDHLRFRREISSSGNKNYDFQFNKLPVSLVFFYYNGDIHTSAILLTKINHHSSCLQSAARLAVFDSLSSGLKKKNDLQLGTVKQSADSHPRIHWCVCNASSVQQKCFS